MARQPVEKTLADLHALRANPSSPDLRPRLTDALSSKTNLIVARAADIIRDLNFSDLAPLLIPPFDRFLNDPSTDKGCPALIAIARTLYELGHDAPDLFLRGIRHRQSSWGSADPAAEVRGLCALGLVRIAYRDVINELVTLLMDKESIARIYACRALAYTGRDDVAAPLLRLKILTGDRDPDVSAEAFTALVRLTPDNAVFFIAPWLDDDNEGLRTAAALSLGESRRPSAFDLLRTHYERTTDPDARRTLLVALSLLRLPQSIDYLVNLATTAPAKSIPDLLDALKIYSHDDSLRARLRSALVSRNDLTLLRLLSATFP
jgi:HEAT repeat protein